MLKLAYEGAFPGGIWSTGSIVHLAMLAYVSGFVLKNQIALRLLVLAGSFAYIAYYYLHPAEPLWGAIFASAMIIAAGAIGLARIFYGRMRIAIPADELAIFDAMNGLTPGEFRRLMAAGETVRADAPARLTSEGVAPDHVFFLSSGEAAATKAARRFRIGEAQFIGEIGYVLGVPASATVEVSPGAVYVRWEKARLARHLTRSPELKRAFDALLSRDMANKVASSVQIDRAVPPAADAA